MRATQTVLIAIILILSARSQAAGPPDAQAATPEIKRLQEAFAGEWNTTETMTRGEFFPNGGGRAGSARFRIATGGTTAVWEGHSDGSAGKLDYLIVIWWDRDSHVYQYLTCFNGSGKPCQLRGTAHWEGKNFVNDFAEPVKGQARKFRDTFTDIAPNSFTLVAEIADEHGILKPVIVTRNVRKASTARN